MGFWKTMTRAGCQCEDMGCRLLSCEASSKRFGTLRPITWQLIRPVDARSSAVFSAKRPGFKGESESSLFKGLRRHFRVIATLNLSVEVWAEIGASPSGGSRSGAHVCCRRRYFNCSAFPLRNFMLLIPAPQDFILGFDPMLRPPSVTRKGRSFDKGSVYPVSWFL